MLLSLLAGAAVTLTSVVTTGFNPKAGFLSDYLHPRTRMETMVSNGDGEAYAQAARDPLMSHLSGFDSPYFGNQAEYRLSRPLWVWLIFLASFGQRGWTFGAMVVLEWLSMAWLAYIASRWSMWGFAVLVLPGVLSASRTLTPEPFGMALALTGWFPIIGLVRETYLLFPLAAFLKTRKKKYLVPFGIYLAWQGIVYLRGARGRPSGLLVLPAQGFLHAVPHWMLQDWCAFGLMVLLGLLAFRRYPIEAALFWCLAIVTRADSWASYLDLGRVILPLEVLGLLVITQALSTRKLDFDAAEARSAQ